MALPSVRKTLLCASFAFFAVLPVAGVQAKLVYRCGANLCQANDDGSDRRQLTSSDSGALYAPDLSADGSKVSFFRNDRGARGAFVLDLGTGARRAVGSGVVDDVQMRPDGRRLAVDEFSGSSVAPGRLCYYDAGGGGRACEQPGLGAFGQDYRPDGRLVSLVPSGSGSSGSHLKLCLRFADGSGQSGCEADLVVDDSRYIRDPAVSPDGRLLAVTVTAGPQDALGFIGVYDLGNGHFVRAVSGGALDNDPAWTADSRRVLFTRGRNTSKPSIWSVAADGPAGSEERIVASGLEPTTSAPVTAGFAVSGLKVARTQKGSSVRGGVQIGFDDSTLSARVLFGKKVVGRLTRRGVDTGRVSVRVRLGAAGRKALRKRGRLRVKLAVTVVAPNGARRTVAKPLTLKP